MKVKLDWLVSGSGIPDVEVECDETLLSTILEDQAEGFLRAGGALTPQQWYSLSDVSKNAFIAAGDRVREHNIGILLSLFDGILDIIGKAKETSDEKVRSVITDTLNKIESSTESIKKLHVH